MALRGIGGIGSPARYINTSKKSWSVFPKVVLRGLLWSPVLLGSIATIVSKVPPAREFTTQNWRKLVGPSVERILPQIQPGKGNARLSEVRNVLANQESQSFVAGLPLESMIENLDNSKYTTRLDLPWLFEYDPEANSVNIPSSCRKVSSNNNSIVINCPLSLTRSAYNQQTTKTETTEVPTSLNFSFFRESLKSNNFFLGSIEAGEEIQIPYSASEFQKTQAMGLSNCYLSLAGPNLGSNSNSLTSLTWPFSVLAEPRASAMRDKTSVQPDTSYTHIRNFANPDGTNESTRKATLYQFGFEGKLNSEETKALVYCEVAYTKENQ